MRWWLHFRRRSFSKRRHRLAPRDFERKNSRRAWYSSKTRPRGEGHPLPRELVEPAVAGSSARCESFPAAEIDSITVDRWSATRRRIVDSSDQTLCLHSERRQIPKAIALEAVMKNGIRDAKKATKPGGNSENSSLRLKGIGDAGGVHCRKSIDDKTRL